MTIRWKKAITAVVLTLLFSASQVCALSAPQGAGTPKKGQQPGAKSGSAGAHEDSGKGNDPPCRRGRNPSRRHPCGQPHPEDPGDCDCGIGNDGQRPQPHRN